MARIRSTHPGQWTDEDFVECSPLARLLCLGLRNEADDKGIFEWKPKGMKMRLLPADNADVDGLLAELVANNQIKGFEHQGKKYGAIRNFRKYQSPKTPNDVYPIPDDFRIYVGLKAKKKGTTSENGTDKDGPISETQDDNEGSISEMGGKTPEQMEEEGGRRKEEGDSTSSGEPEISTEASETSPPPPDDAVEGKAEGSEADDKTGANEPDGLNIPESLRRPAPLEAKDFIGLFDDLIETHFGANKRRPWPNQGDYTTAKTWLDNGADLALVENVVGAAMAGMAGRGKEPPGTLSYLTKAVAGAIKGAKEPLPDVAATRGAQGPGLHVDAEQSKWAARLQGYREKGFWLASYGPEPGQPGCEVPAKLLEKEQTDEK